MVKNICFGNWVFLFISVGLLTVTLSGCGSKGDLYLPDTTETTKDKKKAN
jgi:predicted small lipoprotein YifL